MIPGRGFFRIFSLVSMVLILIVPGCGFALCESDVEGARSALELAEEAVASAYVLVLEAEGAGGEISELVARLNDALEYLSGAERAFESGEYDGAVMSAGKAVEASDAVGRGAVGLKRVAEVRSGIQFRNRLVLSFELVFFTVLLGFLGWSMFKRYYLRRMRGLRPEVAADEP